MNCTHAAWDFEENCCVMCGATAGDLALLGRCWSQVELPDSGIRASAMTGGPGHGYAPKRSQHGPSESTRPMAHTEECLDQPDILTHWKLGETRFASDYEVYCKRTHAVLDATPIGDPCEANSVDGWVDFAHPVKGKERVSGMDIVIRRKAR